MDSGAPSQQRNWYNNTYTIGIIRILSVLGLFFLIKSLHRRYQSTRPTGGRAVADASEIGPETLVPEAPYDGAMSDLGSDDGTNEAFENTVPQSAHISPEALYDGAMSDFGPDDGTNEAIEILVSQSAHTTPEVLYDGAISDLGSDDDTNEASEVTVPQSAHIPPERLPLRTL